MKMTYKPTTKCKIENIHEHIQEINRGVGSVKSKKGKGSYSRKEKYKSY